MVVHELLLGCQLKETVWWLLWLLIYSGLMSRSHARRIVLLNLLYLVKDDMLLILGVLDTRVVALLTIDARHANRVLLLLRVFINCKLLRGILHWLTRIGYRRGKLKRSMLNWQLWQVLSIWTARQMVQYWMKLLYTLVVVIFIRSTLWMILKLLRCELYNRCNCILL